MISRRYTRSPESARVDVGQHGAALQRVVHATVIEDDLGSPLEALQQAAPHASAHLDRIDVEQFDERRAGRRQGAKLRGTGDDGRGERRAHLAALDLQPCSA